MMEQYRSWHRDSVERAFEPVLVTELGLKWQEMTLPGICPCEMSPPPPVLECARREVEDTWRRLEEAVAAELGQASQMSVHYEWIVETREMMLESETPARVYGVRADRLFQFLRDHELFDRERDAVRQIAWLLKRFSQAMRTLADAEYKELTAALLGSGETAYV